MGVDNEKIPSWGQFFKQGTELRDAIIQPEGYGYQVMVNGTKIMRSTELLASEKMKKFMKEIRQDMDIIIIDAPHTQKRSDTEVLARMSDISLLIVKQNYTLAKYINDSIDMLNGYGNGLLGCIFNDVMNGRSVLSSGYGYGYGYGYGKYGKYGRYGHYGVYRQAAKKESENE